MAQADIAEAGASLQTGSKLYEQLVRHGMDSLLRGGFQKAWWALDSALRLCPDRGPRLWQRGVACFYCGKYAEGVRQFEVDITENGSDVEEVIWHFLCRCKLHGFQKALAEGFLHLSGDPCVPPMLEVLSLFQGKGTVQEVFSAATNQDGSAVLSYNGTSALAYANFYVGLYYELKGATDQAREHLKAAAEMQSPDFVGKVMQMHYQLFCTSTLQRGMIPSFTLGDEESGRVCSSIIQGGWQLSGGHLIVGDRQTEADLVVDLLRAYDAGINMFTCGDIYTGVEELYGRFIAAHCKRGGKIEDITVCTTLVPDLDAIREGRVDEKYVRGVIRRSLNHFGVKCLDLVQFHWWDYSVPGYLKAAKALQQLCKEGLVRYIGLTNCDTEQTREMVDAGIPVASTQIQYSLLDRRPHTSGLVSLCEEHGIKILPYGVLAGGFLTDSWLGAQQPDSSTLANRSLVKYLLIIEEFGGWELYQELLRVLRGIADRCSPVMTSTPGGLRFVSVSIAMVAIQYVLSQNQVGGIIYGAHDGRHLQSTIASTALELSEEDLEEIAAVLSKAKGPSGSVFGLERDVSGCHGRIMRYNLSQLNEGAHLEELCHRYLRLHFQAHTTEATRTGYRLPASEGYQTFCREFCSGKLHSCSSPLFDSQQYVLLSAKSCSYDHSLDISAEQEIVEFCTRVRSLLREAEGIEESSLTPDQLADKRIIIAQLNLELVTWERLQMHRRDPGFFLPLNAILYLLPCWGSEGSLPSSSQQSLSPLAVENAVHPAVVDLSISARLVSLLCRLREIPRTLQNARENLSTPVEVFVTTALETCGSFQGFLKNDVPLLSRMLASVDSACNSGCNYQPVLDEIALASEVAATCVERYKAFLREELLPQASSASGIGKEVYESVLKYSHFIDSSEELLALGESHFKKVKGELEVLAKEIDPTKTWQEITDGLIRPMHPQASDLLSAYMAEIQRAREHMQARDLVRSLPQGENVVGFYTPKFLVPFSPFGDFLNPPPFAGMGHGSLDVDREVKHEARVGHLMLHSVEAMHLSEEEEEKLLRAHDYTWISVIAPHEAYPGHHVQALLAQCHPRILRKYYESPLFYEGWGLYTEELAYETGFFEKEITVAGATEKRVIPPAVYAELARLTQLRLQLWRAARVILDVKINTGELSFQDCREFLHREVMFNSRSSAGEVFMYISRPSYAVCYVAGFVLFMNLREQMMKKCLQSGRAFCLKDFHDVVLSKGCIPFKLLDMLLD